MSTPPPSSPPRPQQRVSSLRPKALLAAGPARLLSYGPWEALATGGAMFAFGVSQGDLSEASEAQFLALLTLWVLTALTPVVMAGSQGLHGLQGFHGLQGLHGFRRASIGFFGLGCVLAIWTLRQGSHRGATVSWLLCVAMVYGAWMLWKAQEDRDGRIGLLAIWGWFLGWQALVHGGLLVKLPSHLWEPSSGQWAVWIATLIAAPTLAALGVWAATARLGSYKTLYLAMLVGILGGGWSLMSGSAVFFVGVTLAVLPRFLPAISKILDSLPTLGRRIFGSPVFGMFMLALWLLSVLPALYPWLRDEPLKFWLDLPGAPQILGIIGFLAVMSAGIDFMARRSGLAGSVQPLPLAMTTAAVAVLAIPLPQNEVYPGAGPTLLTESNPQVVWDLSTDEFDPLSLKPPRSGGFTTRSSSSDDPYSGLAGGIMVETDLVHGADLDPGTKVVQILWLHGDRKFVLEPIFSGVDTDDWASGREDLRSRPGRSHVSAWTHRVAPDGSFFSRTFRSLRAFKDGKDISGESESRPDGTVRILVQRSRRLPPEVQVRIHRLEIRR